MATPPAGLVIELTLDGVAIKVAPAKYTLAAMRGLSGFFEPSDEAAVAGRAVLLDCVARGHGITEAEADAILAEVPLTGDNLVALVRAARGLPPLAPDAEPAT